MQATAIARWRFKGPEMEGVVARWYARICENFDGTRVSVVATPWDQALANRVPLDLGAVAEPTLDAKLAMAEVVLRGVDWANRRRHGLLDEEGSAGYRQRSMAEPPRWPSGPMPPASANGAQERAADAAPVRPISWQNGAGELARGLTPAGASVRHHAKHVRRSGLSRVLARRVTGRRCAITRDKPGSGIRVGLVPVRPWWARATPVRRTSGRRGTSAPTVR